MKIVELAPGDAAPVLKKYVSQFPIVRPFFDVTPESDLRDFVAEAPRHPVFRIEPHNTPVFQTLTSSQ